MAQTGYTPIKIYASSTASAVPLAANLDNTNGAELAINIADGKLFYKDSGGTVKVIAGTGGTGVVAGSNTQIQFNNNGVFGASSNLTWDGTYLTANSIKNTALTNGRVTYAGASGLLQDSANLTYDGTTLATGGKFGITGNGASPTATALQIGTNGVGTRWVYNAPTGGEHDFSINGANAAYIAAASVGGFTSGGSVAWSLSNATAGALTLDSSGKLLVRTSTARANITTDANLVSDNGLGIVATSTTYGQASQYIRLMNNGFNYAGSISQTASTGIGLYSAGDLILGANSATVATVAPTSINLFANSQNNTWGVNYKAIDLNGSFVTANGGNTIVIGTGAYINSSGNWIRTTDGYASSQYSQSVGGHTWSYAGASTIGSTITYTALAYLTSVGYGIGVSPEYKLDVLGGSGSIATARVWNGSSGGSDGAQLLLGNSANYTNAYFRLNGGGNSSQLGVGSLNIGLVENAPLGLYTSNALRMSITGAGKAIIGASTTPYGKLYVNDTGALNQNSLTIASDNSTSAGDWAVMEHCFQGSWSTNSGAMAVVNVTDGLTSSLTAATVGQYGIGFDGGGFFAVKRLYNGNYGGSGIVFKTGISDTYFSGTTTQAGSVSTQNGIVTTMASFDIGNSVNRRVQVSLSNYTWTKFRIYALRTNSGNSVALWEGVLNNNFNTSFTNVFSSVSGGGTISLTVSSPSAGVWNFDFNSSGSGASGYYVKEDPGYGSVTVTTY